MVTINPLKIELPRWPRADVFQALALAVIMALAAGLRFTNLEALGYANHYYTAAVESMLQSWHNFFFVAAEPGGAVSVDKPPLGLWLQAISAYFLGVNGFAVLLPEIVAGLLSVLVVYHLVRRSFGPAAGLLAALVLATTPVVVATDRNNTIDSLLILTLLLAAWTFTKATESGKLRPLLSGALLVGLGFNIKMLQAYLPLPAFYALYFFGATARPGRKVANLALATVLLLLVSLSWAVAVDLTPADQRPYVGSSGDNSVLSLALGYNGLQRLFGMGFGGSVRPPDGAYSPFSRPAPGPGGSPPRLEAGANGGFRPPARGQNEALPPGPANGFQRRSGPPAGGGVPGTGSSGLLRLFTPPLSKEMSWLLPFGLVSAGLLALRWRWRWPLVPGHQALVLWGGWLLTGVAFFSVAQFFHEYYLSMLAAPLAALVGIGAVELWRLRDHHPLLAVGLLVTAAGGTLSLQVLTATTFVGVAWWLLSAVALFGLGALLLVLSTQYYLRRVTLAGFAAIIAAMLLTPGAWASLTTLNASGNQSLPSAYSGQRGGLPTRAGSDSDRPVEPPAAPGAAAEQPPGPAEQAGLDVNQALLDYLEPRTRNLTYLMAVPSSMQGADYVIATGRPVLYLGGFNGVDQVVSGDDLARLVAGGKLRYIYWGSDGPGPGGGSTGISTWVTGHCTVVKGFEITSRNAGAPDGTSGQRLAGENGPAPGPGEDMQMLLYDCGD